MLQGNYPKPPAGPHHGWHGFIENSEKIRSKEEYSQIIQKIGSLLNEKISFTLGNSQIEPPDPCLLILRYERMPRGELSLKIELKWEDEQPNRESDDTEQDIIIE